METYPAWTQYNQDFKITTDHLFVNRRVAVKKVLSLPEESELTEETALPNSKYPSDHLRLEAVIQILPDVAKL